MSGLTVSHLSYSYGAKQALREVGFSVAKGQFCALLGPNGAGKSTLFNLLTALYSTPQGEISVAGIDLARQPRAALASMGVVFQQPTLDLDLTVRRNLLYFAALHGIGSKEASRRADAALDQLGMAERAGERVRALNGGHRRRMEIARALLHQPQILLLDEATVGLDAGSRAAITDHVHSLADQGLCVLWATHLTDEVKDSDLVLVLHKGEIIAEDRAADLRGSVPLREVFLHLTRDTSAGAAP